MKNDEKEIHRNPLNFFKSELVSLLQECYPDLESKDFKFENPPSPKYGHLALACFPFAKKFKKSPNAIAQDIAGTLPPIDFIDKSNPIGPYLNFFFKSEHLANVLFSNIQSGIFGNLTIGENKTVLIEFSSPNTNKPLHLGHGRNNMLGYSLSKLFKKCGYNVIKITLVNDRGIHICKSMLAYSMFGGTETPEQTGMKSDHFVGKYYVKFNKENQTDETLEQKAYEMLKEWEYGNKDVLAIWHTMNGWVLKGFDETYKRLGIRFEKTYFESGLYIFGREEIMAAFEKGICYREENGAISIDLKDKGLGKKVLLRGDGTSVYITQDIYTTIKKNRDFSPDYSLFVVGNEQDHHFKVLFETLKKFGYDWARNCEHISYGMITLPEGKMKSREGTVVDLDNLLDEVHSLALEELQKREIERLEKRSELELSQTAEKIAQAAVKFVLLKTSAKKNILFNPTESISFDGMTGPYLQYTHARICSLIRKAKMNGFYDVTEFQWSDEETVLLSIISQFPDYVTQAMEQRNPALLANYIYELTRTYNKYYFGNPIVKASTETVAHARLNLSLSVKTILADTLEIFGIEALEVM